MDRLKQVNWLYHFTDFRNIQSIRDLDGLWSTSKLREMEVNFHPGGNQHSLDADEMFGMDEYVHLCFTTKHPMAYLAQQDGRIEKLQWIYVDDPGPLFEIEGVKFTPGVANKSGMTPCPIADVRESLDVAAIGYLDWSVGDNYQRRQAIEKCEVLVPNHLPLKFFQRLFPKNG